MKVTPRDALPPDPLLARLDPEHPAFDLLVSLADVRRELADCKMRQHDLHRLERALGRSLGRAQDGMR